MKNLGFTLAALGLLTLLGSFSMDTAPEGTHNIGLLQQQMMIFALGGVLAVAGAICGTVDHALVRMEQAGILPSSGAQVGSTGSQMNGGA